MTMRKPKLTGALALASLAVACAAPQLGPGPDNVPVNVPVDTPTPDQPMLHIDCAVVPSVQGDYGNTISGEYTLVIRNDMSYPVNLIEVHVLFYDSTGQQIFGSDGAWPSATIDVGQTMTYHGGSGAVGVRAPDNAATCAVKRFDGGPA